tara:strand:+ start:388 stop:3432 length:3045 start_codon:yes stop_codon:yes gene_type:complete
MNFSFSERRLLHFSPPVNPQQGKGPELQEVLTDLEKGMDAPQAKQLVADLIATANTDEEKAKDDLKATVEKAATLEFDHLVATGKSPEEALAEVQKDFGMFRLDFSINATTKKLEMKASAETANHPEPTTHEERIMYGIEDAMATFSNPKATMGQQIAAVFKIFALAKDFLKRAMNGTLGDSYESPNSKRTREQKEAAKRRNEIRQDIRNELRSGTTPAALQLKKEGELTNTKNNIQKKKGEITTKNLELKQQQEALAKVPAGTDAATNATATAQRNAIQANITNIQKDISTLQTALDALIKEEADLNVYIKEITNIGNEQRELPEKIKSMLKQLGKALSELPEEKVPGSNALGALLQNANATPEPGMKIKVVDSAGNPINGPIQAILKKPPLDKDVSDDDMGMDAGGNVINSDKFAEFMTSGLLDEINISADELQEVVRGEIKNKVEGKDADGKDITGAVLLPNKDKILSTLDKPNTWVEVELAGPPAVKGGITFVDGEVWFQSEDGQTAKRLNTSKKDAEWDAQPNTYFTGTEAKPIPNNAKPDKRDRLYEYESKNGRNNWRKLSMSEIVANNTLTITEDAGNPIDAATLTEALKGPGWTEYTAFPNYEFYYDGNDTFIMQTKDKPTEVEYFDLDAFGDDPVNTQMQDKPDHYFNGTDIVKIPEDVPVAGKRDRGNKFEDHKWIEKSKKEIVEHALANPPAGAPDPKEVAAVGNPNAWKDGGATDDYFWSGETLYKSSADGKTAHEWDSKDYVDNNNDTWKPIPNKYVNGSGNTEDVPNDSTHKYDRAKHKWAFDEDLAINNLVPASAKEKRGLDSLKQATDWKDNSEYPKYEGIRVGNTIYLQYIDSPKWMWVADLEKGTYTKKPGKYFDGSSEQNLPAERFRTEYDTASRTWKKLDANEAKLLKKKRMEDGALILDNPDVLSITKNSDTSYTLVSKEGKIINFRFNTSTNKWDWQMTSKLSATNSKWYAMKTPLAPGGGADAKRKEGVNAFNAYRTKLLAVNNSNELATS